MSALKAHFKIHMILNKQIKTTKNVVLFYYIINQSLSHIKSIVLWTPVDLEAAEVLTFQNNLIFLSCPQLVCFLSFICACSSFVALAR